VRLSLDLHDLLGHSLATTALQGDLALTLLPHAITRLSR
jgi:signal transduction histidine kinase